MGEPSWGLETLLCFSKYELGSLVTHTNISMFISACVCARIKIAHVSSLLWQRNNLQQPQSFSLEQGYQDCDMVNKFGLFQFGFRSFQFKFFKNATKIWLNSIIDLPFSLLTFIQYISDVLMSKLISNQF